MQLTSEVENVLNGSLVKETDNIKAIAVSDATINPDANGIVPLSKQNALMPSAPTQAGVIEEKPIDVATPEMLESLSFSTPEEETPAAPVAENTEEKVEEPINISLPTQEDVLAQEPMGVNNNLFVNDNLPPVLDNNSSELPQMDAAAESPVLENPLAGPTVETPTEPEMPPEPEMPTETMVPEEPIMPEEPEEVELPDLSNELPPVEENNNFVTNENVGQINDIEELSRRADELIDKFKKEMDDLINIFKNNNNLNNNVVTPGSVPTFDSSNETVESVNDLTPPVEPNSLNNEVPQVPSLDNGQPEQVDDLMADAMNQINNLSNPTTENINNSEIPSVDDTQIKGMFI